MSQLTGLYAIWLREVKVFFRERSRLIGSLLTPLLWLLVVGKGIGASIKDTSEFGGYEYSTFIFPGILCMTVLFTSVFYGLYIIWDRKIDFLKEVLVSPLNRSTIFLGKVLGGCTDSLVQGCLLLLLAPLLFPDLTLTPYSIGVALLFLFLLAIAMSSLGLIIGSRMESPEGFSLVTGLVVFPMYFLSGALFPKENLPVGLKIATTLNPVTYAVDAIRQVMLGMHEFGLLIDLGVLVAFCTVLVAIGTWSFHTMRL